MTNEKLYDWVFHFSPYTNKWAAVKREDYNLLFNDFNSPKVLRSSSITTLQTLINKTNGDVKKLQTLVTK